MHILKTILTRRYFSYNSKMTKPYTPILKYWFGEDLSLLKSEDYAGNNKLWFATDPNTDKYITDNFSSLLTDAEHDKLNDWKSDPQGSLSLIILLDQFSRNIYRGQPKMFANDKKALDISFELINDKSNKINELSVAEKKFVLMPLMHSEDLETLKKCLNCYRELADNAPLKLKPGCEYSFKFAKEHFDIIEKFGRYPHRNELLGRESTQEEIDFLKNTNSVFFNSVKPATSK